jgi:hypothetical protein
VQIVVDQALGDGVPAPTLRAGLSGSPDALPEADRLALAFGRAVAEQSPETEALREALQAHLGRTALVEIALGVATAQVFPILKRGLGRATACALVTVEVPGPRDAA